MWFWLMQGPGLKVEIIRNIIGNAVIHSAIGSVRDSAEKIVPGATVTLTEPARLTEIPQMPERRLMPSSRRQDACYRHRNCLNTITLMYASSVQGRGGM